MIILRLCLDTLSEMDENFSRGLKGIILAVKPFPEEGVPRTWIDAMHRYEREFPSERNLFNTFKLEERNEYEKVYTILIDNLDIIQTNTDHFTQFLESYVDRIT